MKIKTLLNENTVSILIKKDPNYTDEVDMDEVQEDFQRYMEDTWSFEFQDHPQGFVVDINLDGREIHELEDDLYNLADQHPIDFERHRA